MSQEKEKNILQLTCSMVVSLTLPAIQFVPSCCLFFLLFLLSCTTFFTFTSSFNINNNPLRYKFQVHACCVHSHAHDKLQFILHQFISLSLSLSPLVICVLLLVSFFCFLLSPSFTFTAGYSNTINLVDVHV